MAADSSSRVKQAPALVRPQAPIDRTTISVASGDVLDVRQFEIIERMSSLFEVRLVVVSNNPDIELDAVVGKPMSFALHAGNSGNSRSWAGICSHLQQLRVEDQFLSTYELTLVPTLWLATQRRNFRMFQRLSELDIVLKLLTEWGIQPTLRMSTAYKARKYRVQYGETDFAFMSRMLEDAGISFYFDNSGTSQLVLDDGPQNNEARPSIAFHDQPTTAELEHVTAVRVGRRVRPGRYTMRDHDYRRPANFQLIASASSEDALEERLERYHYAPGAFLFEGAGQDATPAADDKGAFRPDAAEGELLAKRRLDAQRADARETSFQTNVLDLAPGTILGFMDHPKSELAPEKRLLILESSFVGQMPGRTVHHCTAVSAESRFQPALRTPKPKVQGVESATVVGPPGQEIHTDEFGRVRVHFHWDRESAMNDDSSCWIHVNQAWGGSGYGASNLPRIGQEVIVDFLGGDPDRPIIVGRVYTNLQKTPYALPQNQTQSGWKSSSSPATGGYNEIMFEDKAGSELLRMQAEKNLQKLVKNDEQREVGHDRSTAIGNNDSKTVGNDSATQIMKNALESVGALKITQVGERVSLICGKSEFHMDKDGNITLKGVNILMEGAKHVQIYGEPIDLN